MHFGDRSRIASWVLAAVEEAVAAGYLTGFPKGTFEPLGLATRAQPAKVLAETLKHRTSS